MSDDPDLRAAEYVLGTLDAAQRAAFERDRASDPKLAAAQAFWEARLGPLAGAVPPVVPSAGLWAAIRDALPERWPAAAPATDLVPALRRWRRIALAAGALAAGLALVIALDGLHPDPPEARYLAVIDRGGDLPALVVGLDARTGIVQVRALAAEAPRERSLELWFVAQGASPRSLGLVADAPRTRLVLPAADRAALDGAMLAVTVEPPGGSPSGNPTGPVVYSGRLVRE